MSVLAGKRVLVTGASGFIGANLVRALLDQDAQVHAVVRSPAGSWRLQEVLHRITAHAADITDGDAVKAAVRQSRPDFVCHLAATHGHPMDAGGRARALQVSVMGTSNLLEAVRESECCRFVHVGSSLEYGPRSRPLRETDPLLPTTFRGVVKAASMLLCLQFWREQVRPVVMLRPFSVYGPWESPERLIPTAIRAALDGLPLDLTAPGIRRDPVFVADVVQACLLALTEPRAVGQVINVGSGQQVTNEQIVEAVQIATGRTLHIRVGAHQPHPPDTTCWVADIRRAARLLHWAPSYTLDQGLRATVEWHQRHPASLAGAS